MGDVEKRLGDAIDRQRAALQAAQDAAQVVQDEREADRQATATGDEAAS